MEEKDRGGKGEGEGKRWKATKRGQDGKRREHKSSRPYPWFRYEAGGLGRGGVGYGWIDTPESRGGVDMALVGRVAEQEGSAHALRGKRVINKFMKEKGVRSTALTP